MEIGFIGLGNLGTVMVDNLLERGRHLHLYNRSKQKLKAYEGKATIHESIASLAEACDIIISIVSDDKAVEAISLGDDGLVNNMKKGAVHVCLSTIAPATSASLHEAHQQKGLEYFSATVIGRPEVAKARNTTVCMSGITQHKEAVVEVLKDLGGKNFYDFGEDVRSAAVIKLCNNFLILAALEAMGEAFNLVAKSGADTAAFFQMITETLFSAPIYKIYGKIIVDKTYDTPGFTSQLGLKDTKLALALAEEVGATVPIADVVKNHFIINHNRGRNGYDWTSIAKVIEEESSSL
ncbi:NAD(P)-dependent oxidoreductase [Aridibaculum aurantiacum]|uniref:NAD(P)-dependent oxidoreductase n=1 Tax=Aridibaculum aurantiacum TaxID=2810307 RepID=UPI001A9563D0|nr:NAD(P)-dependent oxidoreductase [Aridibaculum aurantiacum]